MAISMLYVGLYVRISPPVSGAPVPPAGYAALVFIFVFAAFFELGWGGTCWIYVSEIPTARLRSLNVAFAAASQWLFNFVVARSVPNMLVTMGSHGYGYVRVLHLFTFGLVSYDMTLPIFLGPVLIRRRTYIFFGCFCLGSAVFAWFFVPETKGEFQPCCSMKGLD